MHRGNRLEVLWVFGPELGDLRRRIGFGGRVDNVGLPGLGDWPWVAGLSGPSTRRLALWRIDPGYGRPRSWRKA